MNPIGSDCGPRLSHFGLAEVQRFEIGAALWGGHWDRAARLLLTANRVDALGPASKARCEVAVGIGYRSVS